MLPLAEGGLSIETQAVLVAVAGARTVEVATGIRPDLIQPHRLTVRYGLGDTRGSQPSFDLVLCGMKLSASLR